jgi:hypothetical protein
MVRDQSQLQDGPTNYCKKLLVIVASRLLDSSESITESNTNNKVVMFRLINCVRDHLWPGSILWAQSYVLPSR